MFWCLGLVLLAVTAYATEPTVCVRIPIASLKARYETFRVARTCWPKQPGLFPLHVFAHGDFGGGGDSFVYWGLQEAVASRGFVVAMYESCWQDQECFNGQESFREVLKTLEHFEAHPTAAPINFTLPYSVSGHSTGGRVALMLASIRDNPNYLSGTRFNVSANERKVVNRIQAMVGDHPDLMSLAALNPDLTNYSISATPVMVVTGTADRIEPELSGWRDFLEVRHANKIFVNVVNATHLAPISPHHEAPFIAAFASYFALGNQSQEQLLFSNVSGALFNDENLPIARPGDHNSGDNKVGAVACQVKAGRVAAFPEELAPYCTKPP